MLGQLQTEHPVLRLEVAGHRVQPHPATADVIDRRAHLRRDQRMNERHMTGREDLDVLRHRRQTRRPSERLELPTPRPIRTRQPRPTSDRDEPLNTVPIRLHGKTPDLVPVAQLDRFLGERQTTLPGRHVRPENRNLELVRAIGNRPVSTFHSVISDEIAGGDTHNCYPFEECRSGKPAEVDTVNAVHLILRTITL